MSNNQLEMWENSSDDGNELSFVIQEELKKRYGIELEEKELCERRRIWEVIRYKMSNIIQKSNPNESFNRKEWETEGFSSIFGKLENPKYSIEEMLKSLMSIDITFPKELGKAKEYCLEFYENYLAPNNNFLKEQEKEVITSTNNG